MIDYIDPVNRLIYLDASTVNSTIQPIDIYREMRTLRQNDESLRPFDVFMTMKGAEKKNPDGSKRTERYAVLLDGTLIVPYDTSHVLTVDGTIITDDGLEGVQCFNRVSLSVDTVVDINYVPKQVEVITVNTAGSDLTASDVWNYGDRTLTSGTSGITDTDIHNALDSYSNKADYKADLSPIPESVWTYLDRTLTSIQSTLTAQEVWEYAVRSLTDTDMNVVSINDSLVASVDDFKADISSIPSDVWNYNNRELTYIKPDVLTPNTIEVDKVSNISIKINTNPLNESYSFDVYYRIPGMSNYESLGVTLDEVEFDYYSGEFTFNIEGSYMLKFVEINNKIDDIFSNITVIKPNNDDILKETWEVSL